MWKVRILALSILLVAGLLGFFTYSSQGESSRFPFRLGLDLSGGVHLVYTADVSSVPDAEINASMESLRDVIERRVNLFGVSEPLIQTESGSTLSGEGREERLIVELPGVTDVNLAIELIGETPVLEFKEERPNGETQAIVAAQQEGNRLNEDPFIATELTGRFLDKARLEFDPTTRQAYVSLQFDDEGAALFEQITAKNIGKYVAIYLDGSPISVPVVQEAISGGRAQISGSMTPDEAKELVGRLNSGALPVPISLISTQSVGPHLGQDTLNASVNAGIYSFIAVSLFLLLWYRLPGLVSIFALVLYVILNLVLFKLIPVTLTAAGIAAFILSIGMAVDANILIFERLKEELKKGKEIEEAMREGFARAWTSIRDSNSSSIITAVILYWFAASNIIKGFALVFLIGVLVSMFSAITASRVFLYALPFKGKSKTIDFLFGSGISK